jgi:hypothetical protein
MKPPWQLAPHDTDRLPDMARNVNASMAKIRLAGRPGPAFGANPSYFVNRAGDVA